MKKLCALILCVLLVSVVAFSAFAAGETTVKVTASATEVKRGDEVTITVSVAGDNVWSSMGYIPYIPSDYFTVPADGEALMAGMLVEFTAADGGVILLNSASAAAGDAFRFTIKIKDDAPFGEFKVSDPAFVSVKNGSAAVPVLIDEPTFTVVCDHNFGAWANKDAEKHERICSICSAPETEAHAWNAGTVTTNPSCFEKGEKTFECACGATKTEPVEATGNHVYGAWSKKDDAKHTRACTTVGCTATEEAAHAWDNGTVTTNPSCFAKGEKTFACTCGATKTEPVEATGNHVYGAWSKKDDEKHVHTCTTTGCTASEEAAHAWDEGTVTKEPKCNEKGETTFACACGATKTAPIDEIPHELENITVAGDKHSGHCTACDQDVEEEHEFTEAKFDAEKHWEECVCGEKHNEAEHAFGTGLNSDENGHWYACACGAKKDEAAHTLTYKVEGDKHFQACECGFETAKVAHEYAADNKCACGAEKPAEPTEPKDPVKDPAQPSNGDNSFVMPLVVLMVLSACGMAVTVVAKKKFAR